MSLAIYYDAVQEGAWFQRLHPSLSTANLVPIPSTTAQHPTLAKVLAYDRPDIILTEDDEPILVVERTIEVPSGHNVGQRFGRLVAAAEAKVPVVYFGPYAARKHGGATQGPRYMNLRLFYALDVLARINSTAVTTIDWPVDDDYEIRRDSAKDEQIRKYVALFLSDYAELGRRGVNGAIMTSDFQRRQIEDRDNFSRTRIRNAERYDGPPESVRIENATTFAARTGTMLDSISTFDEIVGYSIGMNKIRSDPYTGMGLLYRYLYVLGETSKNRGLVLEMPNINKAAWVAAAVRPRKDIRIFRRVADGIVFADGFSTKTSL